MDQEYFCPSVYELMWKKVKLNETKQMCCDMFYLPDTIFIEYSQIKYWYFSSLYDTCVLKKNKESLNTEAILSSFSADVYPLSVCCSVCYIDFNQETEIIHKTHYFTPPQLRYFLSQLKTADITCIIQKIVTQLPDLHVREDKADLFVKHLIQNATKQTQAKFHLNEPVIRDGPVTQQSFNLQKQNQQPSSYFQVLKIDWTPSQINASGRRSRTQFNLFKFSPDVRCSSYFADHLQADQFALSESRLQFINQAFSRLAIHISMSTNNSVKQMSGYVQVFECPTKREELKQNAPVLLFLTSLELESGQIDEKWALQLKFQIRKSFQPAQLLPYETTRKVITAFANEGAIGAVSPLLKRIYELALDQNIYEIASQTERKSLLNLTRKLTGDLESNEAGFRERAYTFLCQLIDKVARDEKMTELQQLMQANDRTKHQCARCCQYCATNQYQFKHLLSEPLLYFKEVIPAISYCYKLVSLGDCYSLIQSCLFGDFTVIQHRTQLRDTIKKYLQNYKLEKIDEVDQITLIQGPLEQLVQKEDMQKMLPETTEFFKNMREMQLRTKINKLDYFTLKKFYFLETDSLQSVVPLKLLKNSNIIKANLDYTIFLSRLDREEFYNQNVWICSGCFSELLKLQKMIEE
ncbi:Conserved_hypothetical protein [Hexamita inflata]|uniref:Uncharacterized protein n=2 Tax=Hexamita inflata TaxID=28002 RepID=A0AA86TSZ1_9EUKA|nr:Conserved hypothetical protein [Hexamita inflata]